MRNAKIKERQHIDFFAAIATMTRDETLAYCTKLIIEARAPNYTLINQLKSMNKDRFQIDWNNLIYLDKQYYL